MKNFKQIFIFSVAILALAFYLGFNSPVNGSSTDNVSGYAWEADGPNPSPPGLGGTDWLSFNCVTDPAGCGASNYGVTVDSVTGNMSGYAWSDNFGWMKFGGLSGFPTGSGTTPSDAKVDLSTGTVTGWARFCSVFVTGCSGSVLPTTATGGWDGWVSLSGDNYASPNLFGNGGVTYNKNSGSFKGYAWGGPDVVGWIDFSQVLYASNSGEPLLFLKANNDTGNIMVQVGDQVTLSSTGSGLNTAGGVASGSWSGNQICPGSLTPPGTVYSPSFTLNTAGTYRYTLDCNKADGSGVITSSVYVTVVNSITYCEANPNDPACIPPSTSGATPHYIEH